MKCSICQSIMRPIEKVRNCVWEPPRYTDQYRECPRTDLSLFQCLNCGHFEISPVALPNIYEEYEMDAFQASHRSLSKLQEKIQRLEEYSPDTESILEIGCGDGHALQIARSQFSYALGIEPSCAYQPIEEPSVEIIHTYFDASLSLSRTFSAFMANQVFEHLENPVDLLQAIYHVLKPGGVGLINVPDGARILKENLYHQILAEHIQYFTPMSLAMMAKYSGFEVIEIIRDNQAIELDLYVSKIHKNEGDGIAGMETQKQNDQKALIHALRSSQNITIWGAGMKSHAYLPLLTPEICERIHYFVDTSPAKWGKYASEFPMPVQNVSQEILEQSDTIIILASSYNQEVISALKDTFSYTGKIIYFENKRVCCIH